MCQGKRSSKEEFIEKARKIHGDKYNYDKSIYINSKTKVEILCNKCNAIFFQTPNDHLMTKGCGKCADKFTADIRRSSLDDFIVKAKIIHKDNYNYEKSIYKGNKIKIEIFCNKCENIFWQIPTDHLKGCGCPKCGLISRSLKRSSTTESFILKAKIIFGDKFDYRNVVYINNRIKVEIICNICSTCFLKSPNKHLNGQGCPFCRGGINISKSETEWLDSLNIKIRSKIIKINDRKFVVDGFDPETNTVYEFNGDYWHGNPEIFNPNSFNKNINKTFSELYKTTLEKEKLLKLSGYNIISIWENDWKKIKENIKKQSPLINRRL